MFAADADDAYIMDHLGQDHEMVRRLHDLMEIVVEVRGKRGRTRSGGEPQQTTFAQGTPLGIVVRACPFVPGIILARLLVGSRGGCPVRAAVLRFRRQWRNVPVWRIAGDRRSSLS